MGEGTRHDEIQGEILHVYDGIEEADNELPLWWLWTFYGAIIFAVGYWFYYHEFEMGPQPMQAYTAALQEAAASGGEVSDALIDGMAADATAVAAGRELFVANCVSCHAENGEGNIGPNLTDDAWLHGGLGSQVYNTIHDGVQGTAMIPWGATLGPAATQQVAAYVVSIRNTNVPGGKDPEGEPLGAGGGDAAPEEGAAPEGDGGDEAQPAEGEGADATPAEGEGADAEPTEGAEDAEPAEEAGNAPAAADDAEAAGDAPAAAGDDAPAEATE